MNDRFAHLSDDPEWRTIHLSDAAGQVIRNCFAQLEKIRAVFGADSDEYRTAVTSFGNCLPNALTRTAFGRSAYLMPHWPEGADKGLSLYCQEESGFEFGMVFFRNHRYDGTDREGVAGEWSLNS